MGDGYQDEARRLLDEEEYDEDAVIQRLVDQGYGHASAKRMVEEAQSGGSGRLRHIARLTIMIAALASVGLAIGLAAAWLLGWITV